MGYRKVSYIEQVWYIIKYKLGERFRRRGTHANKTQTTMFLPRLSQPY